MSSTVSLTKTVITGFGISVTHGGAAINNVRAVTFDNMGERVEQDLSTANNAAVRTKWTSTLTKLGNIVVTKLAEPSLDDTLSTANAALAISFKTLDATTQTETFYAELLSVSPSVLDLDPAEGVAIDLTYLVTNLNVATETGPALT